MPPCQRFCVFPSVKRPTLLANSDFETYRQENSPIHMQCMESSDLMLVQLPNRNNWTNCRVCHRCEPICPYHKLVTVRLCIYCLTQTKQLGTYSKTLLVFAAGSRNQNQSKEARWACMMQGAVSLFGKMH